jgi:hypothetical protein
MRSQNRLNEGGEVIHSTRAMPRFVLIIPPRSYSIIEEEVMKIGRNSKSTSSDVQVRVNLRLRVYIIGIIVGGGGKKFSICCQLASSGRVK